MADKNMVVLLEKLDGLRRVLESPRQLAELDKALPQGLTPERVVRQCMTLVQYTPRLIDCTPQSIARGLIQASELGLELSGVLGQAYLVPRYNKDVGGMLATFQVGYRGIIQLAWKSQHLSSFRMQTVKEADEFDLAYGTSPYLHHKPAKTQRGPAVGYYATASFLPSGFDFVYLTRDEVEEHKAKYADPKSFAWKGDFDPMAEKTCARRLGKRLPMATELSAALTLDEYNEAGVGPTFDQLAAEYQPEGPDKNGQLLEMAGAGPGDAPGDAPADNP
jgi:recombination protein RecT